MEPLKDHIIHVMHLQFHSVYNGTKAAKTIHEIYGKEAIMNEHAEDGFKNFGMKTSDSRMTH